MTSKTPPVRLPNIQGTGRTEPAALFSVGRLEVYQDYAVIIYIGSMPSLEGEVSYTYRLKIGAKHQEGTRTITMEDEVLIRMIPPEPLTAAQLLPWLVALAGYAAQAIEREHELNERIVYDHIIEGLEGLFV